MTPSIYQQRCRFAATSLAFQAAWPAVVVALGLGAPASLRPNGELAVTGLFAALIVLGLSIHLAFDAWLFRLMAEHPDESSGGRAVRRNPNPAASKGAAKGRAGCGARFVGPAERHAAHCKASASGLCRLRGSGPRGGDAGVFEGRISQFPPILSRLLRRVTASALAGFAWLVTGVRPIWNGSAPSSRQRIYFANHASHGDFILLASCLPAEALPAPAPSPPPIIGARPGCAAS